MIFARIESLILDKGIGDALSRAFQYVEAGADGIMIHSRKKEPDEVFTFARNFLAHYPKIPLVVVPTTFNTTTDNQLADAGFRIAIYANHMLRASYPAMQRTAQSILTHGRTHEVEKELISINEILNLIPGTA
jgi:phosphoenolpyruvate phosphomutase